MTRTRLTWIVAACCPLLLHACQTPYSGAAKGSPDKLAHSFYYGWYGNPETDGHWVHWNHQILLQEGGGRRHVPPEDIGAGFYPADGLYSSNSAEDVARQMRQHQEAGMEVIVATWWGEGDYSDKSLDVLFEAAAAHGLHVAFHIEPFAGRNAEGTREALAYLLDKWGDHPALYRDPRQGNRPCVYLYDSYLVSPEEWATLLDPDGAISIRGTTLDAVVIGLWVKQGDGDSLKAGSFDGCYTYFAVDGFTYGSTPANWSVMADFARRNGMIFIPCAGPGYDDLRIRPWNAKNQRYRENGAYYDRMFKAAIDADPYAIGITSFNEWHEGTQIEPAVPKTTPACTYLDQGERPPNWYLDRTRYWVSRWRDARP